MNMSNLMKRAWAIRRERTCTMSTALKLAWGEARGVKLYSYRLTEALAAIKAYCLKLAECIADIHDVHKLDILTAVQTAKVDSEGVAVLDGKTVGLCKYAVRNAA